MNRITAEAKHLLMTKEEDSHTTTAVDELSLSFEGIVGEARKKRVGLTMVADVRARGFAKREAIIRHRQQVSVIDDLSLKLIADSLGISSTITQEEYGEAREIFLARCIGANIVLGAIEFPDERLQFHEITIPADFGPMSEGTFTAAMGITRYNPPCVSAVAPIKELYPLEINQLGQKFILAAKSNRGFVAEVVQEGKIKTGDQITIVERQQVPR